MTIKVSTGLRNAVLGTSSLDAALDLGFIKIYSGAAPASADDAATGTLLCTISVNSTGTGLTFDAPSGGVMAKAAAEVWSGVNAASGTAAYYRHVGPADTGALSTTEPRLQGSVGTSGADLNLSSVGLTAAATQTIDYYTVAWPSA